MLICWKSRRSALLRQRFLAKPAILAICICIAGTPGRVSAHPILISVRDALQNPQVVMPLLAVLIFAAILLYLNWKSMLEKRRKRAVAKSRGSKKTRVPK